MTIEQANQYFAALPEGFALPQQLQAAVDAALSPGGGWQLPTENSNTQSEENA